MLFTVVRFSVSIEASALFVNTVILESFRPPPADKHCRGQERGCVGCQCYSTAVSLKEEQASRSEPLHVAKLLDMPSAL